jgi:hypothetical protein
MLNSHDRALLRDLTLQPLWLLFGYIAVGVSALAVGLVSDDATARWLCAGGGFLIALGAEKLVSRRIRHAARQLMDDSTPGPAAG